MIETARLKHHVTLLDRTAGGMSMDELSDAVLRCTECSNPGHCAGWLAERSEPAANTPGYCRNRDLLHRLQAE